MGGCWKDGETEPGKKKERREKRELEVERRVENDERMTGRNTR